MITIIFAPPRYGKTSLMTHLLNEYAFNSDYNRQMQQEIIHKNANGFDLSIPQHCVASNYDCVFKRFRYTSRYTRRINPYRLGFKNDFVDTHFTIPYQVTGITEAQKYFNSRMSLYYPTWQSNYYEQHGHNNLNFFLDTQRPMLIDANIRDLSRFVEVVKLDLDKDRYGKIQGMKWTIRSIDNSSLYDRYMASGKKDKDCYIEQEIIANYNVFGCYNSQSCKPKFYDGHLTNDFDLDYSQSTDDSLQGYIDYLRKNDDELPKGFYQKRSLIGGI